MEFRKRGGGLMRLLLCLVLSAALVAQAGQMRVVHGAGLGLAFDAPPDATEGPGGILGGDGFVAVGTEHRASTRRGKRGNVDTVWLVCEWQGGKWWPRPDLPPTPDRVIADAVAREQTRMSGRPHEARAFSAR